MKLVQLAVLIFLYKEANGSHRPMDLMADLTNDLGVWILQVQSTLQNGNIAFSPYGLASMSVLLLEGAAGNTALEIVHVMKLPWSTLLVRIGFRDINRHLKTYFKSDGFLRGLIMSRDNVCFQPSYQRILRLYGFNEPDTALTYPCNKFVPYSPSTEIISTITALNNETTTMVTTSNITQEIVTELTQTSQTVVINSSTTSKPLDAETGAARIQARIDPFLKINGVMGSASESKLTTALSEKRSTSQGTTAKTLVTANQTQTLLPNQSAANITINSSLTQTTTVVTTAENDTENEFYTLDEFFKSNFSDSSNFSFQFPTTATEEFFKDSTLDNDDFVATLSSLFNDTEVTEFSSFDAEFENNTFFTSLTNFIDSTTEIIKNTVISTDIPTTTLTFGRNNVSVAANMIPQIRPASLKFDENNLINTSRVNIGESIDPRVLPKKSITESNEDANEAAKYSASHQLPKYINVLSLKTSKSFISKYDIHSFKGPNSTKLKRSIQSNSTNFTEEISSESTKTLQQINDHQNNFTKQGTAFFQVSGNPNAKYSELPFAVSLQAELNNAAYVDVGDFNIDLRRIRSYERKDSHNFNPSSMEWFATPDENVIQIPIFTYSAILPFAYVDELKSKILEIPLDDNNYSLLIILPNPQNGIRYLLNALALWPLRRVWECLRPTPVYASIPKFSLISHVNLRPALYNLGVRDIFHRYQADLSLMSSDEKLYVRDIEQIVTIYVDKFPSSVYPVLEKYTKGQFVASHPFLYFVLDRETGVCLVAGQLTNPLKHII